MPLAGTGKRTEFQTHGYVQFASQRRSGVRRRGLKDRPGVQPKRRRRKGAYDFTSVLTL